MEARYLLIAASLLTLTGCMIEGRRTSATQYSSTSIEMDDSELVRMELQMGAGDLHLNDGGAQMLRADFAYNIPEWKPVVQHTRTGRQSTITVSQPRSSHAAIGNNKYNWDLQVNKKVPLELALNLGAGKARLDLGSVDVRGITVDAGVGEVELDLRGQPQHGYDVAIHGGIGKATVRVLADAPIYAEAQGGIGAVHIQGLQQRGDHWETPSYADAKNRIHISVHGGIGEIQITAD